MAKGPRVMPKLTEAYAPHSALVLGTRLNARVPEADQIRQRTEAAEILRRLQQQPGVILADEVGMGKTFVAIAVTLSIALRSGQGPAIVMVPPNLIDKWEQDLKTFCELYLDDHRAVRTNQASRKDLRAPGAVRFGVARHSVALLRLLDDPSRDRAHLIFLGQGAMSRQQTDKWVRLALIGETLRKHARGRADRLIKVKAQIHRFLGTLLSARGEERAHKEGSQIWTQLLSADPGSWKELFNAGVKNNLRRLSDDPVPMAVVRCLRKTDLEPLAQALKEMPVRARGGEARLNERLTVARKALRKVEENLWGSVLANARWRSPLLVMDEAHHLKNPGTALARQLQSPDSARDLHTGDGALAKAFDRMLFLTATPFQLGHHELAGVMARFGDVRWKKKEMGEPAEFLEVLRHLRQKLDESQRSAVFLQRCWSRLSLQGSAEDPEEWWAQLCETPRVSLSGQERAVLDAFEKAKICRKDAETALRPWILRHNKGARWNGTGISRRDRLEGGAISGEDGSAGLPIPQGQVLPFFLAARSAVVPGKDLLGEALSSSYEAFRKTRLDRAAEKDDLEEPLEKDSDLSHSAWYLDQFDQALESSSGSAHPKVSATVQKAVDLWETGEKVLVFAFYRHTCRALRIHISNEVERRLSAVAQHRLHEGGLAADPEEIEKLLARVQDRFFDVIGSPGRRAVDRALRDLLSERSGSLAAAGVTEEERAEIVRVMRRFLRVSSTLVRCFPLTEFESLKHADAVRKTLEFADSSGITWRQKMEGFLEFLIEKCSTQERQSYLDAAGRTQTRGIRVEAGDSEEDAEGADQGKVTLANVQVITGATKTESRTRLMRGFNTPFFPDILVCSQVMGEGVDLQRFCSHVIHHDLDWNPSTIEQRTGRVDRLGCKAEGRHPIHVYLPYIAGSADERQFRVMTDREKWFRVVMGQDEVARLITPDAEPAIPLPEAVGRELGFELGIRS